MNKYVDSFMFSVPKDKAEEYKKIANDGKDMWIESGALEYYECIGDDLIPRDMGGGLAPSFIDVNNTSSDQNVWISFIVFESKEHRDEVNQKVYELISKRIEANEDMSMPYDMSKLVYGGFKVAVEGRK